MRKETETVGKVIIGIVIGLIIGLVVAAICFSKLDELELKREAKKEPLMVAHQRRRPKARKGNNSYEKV